MVVVVCAAAYADPRSCWIEGDQYIKVNSIFTIFIHRGENGVRLVCVDVNTCEKQASVENGGGNTLCCSH